MPRILSLSPIAMQRAMFAFVCVVWGATWLAMKFGVATVPPGFFSGTRWTAAGILLIGWRLLSRQRIAIPLRLLPRVTLVALLMVSLNAVVLLYSMRVVSSGLAAVIGSALTPISLLGFSVALGEEKFNRRQAVAIALGVVGIGLLFGPKAFAGTLDATELWGSAGVIAGLLFYSAGSVLARKLLLTLSPAEVAASTNMIGGAVLLVLTLAFEPGARAALSGDWGWPAWAAWLYLLLPGSLGATILYFNLVRAWGASRTGSYAFVSPVIAVLLGIAVLGERVEPLEVLGMLLMLLAAGMVLRR